MDSSCKVKVSVLVPVYNVEQFLPRCLDSLIAQTLRDIEIVCVNDASPDNSAAILADYAARDPRIRVITKTNNEGSMKARATAYENARGEYLFFCDSDDYLPVNALESLYSYAIESQTKPDLIVGNMSLVNPNGRTILRNRASQIGTSAESYLKALLHWTTPSLCGTLFKLQLFSSAQLTSIPNITQSEDRLLLTDLLLKLDPSIQPINENVYYYWQNDSSITRRKITPTMAINQFTTLFMCHSMIETHRPKLHYDNNNFIIRYLSLYIEKGVDKNLLINFNDTSRQLLTFSEMIKYVGLRMAIHTTSCIYLPGYRPFMHGIRKIIRKIQGKD